MEMISTFANLIIESIYHNICFFLIHVIVNIKFPLGNIIKSRYLNYQDKVYIPKKFTLSDLPTVLTMQALIN